MKRNLFLFFLLIFSGLLFSANVTGKWTFDDANDLLKASVGNNLVLTGSHLSVAGPTAGNGAVQIGLGSYYSATHNIPKNGGGNYVNEFTFAFDVYLPDKGNWKALYQTNLFNSNDAECFIKPTGELGISSTGYTAYQLSEKEWYRIVITVDLGSSYKYYIDGQLAKEGIVPAVDGNFSLELDKVRFFSDNDGEDGLINVAEITVWDAPLNATEVAALGGYGHTFPVVTPQTYTIYPYLQSPSENSAIICWHDTSTNPDRLDFGTSSSLANSIQSTSEVISGNYIWHTAKLNNLIPDTEYSYKVFGNADTTAIFKFRTLPLNKDVKKLRFLMLSDTQDHPEKNVELITAARNKVTELYGSDFQNQLTAIIHTGDLVGSGSTISQYTDQFFVPFAPFTRNIPTLITAGNHELEHPFFYKYVKNDAISAQPSTHSDFERYWSKRIGSVLLIGLNSTDQTNLQGIFTLQKSWLKAQLDAAESNDSIDFVFCFVHAHPMSELWVTGSIPFVRDQVLPLIKQYSKVQQLTYGHTHGYERGMTLNTSVSSKGDITLLCNGGGGGTRDRWGEYANNNYPEIHTSLEQYFYTLFEIDTQNKSYSFNVYGLGNPDVPLNNVLIDSWTRKLNQSIPQTPQALKDSVDGSSIILKASPFQGTDNLFSSEFQLYENQVDNSTHLIIDKIRDVKDIYGAVNFIPVNLNVNTDITKLSVSSNLINSANMYSWRVRYRDANQKWSEWSAFRNIQLNTDVHLQKNTPLWVWLDKNHKSVHINSETEIRVLNLYNFQGVLVKSEQPLMNNAEVQLQSLPAGVYILQVNNIYKKILY